MAIGTDPFSLLDLDLVSFDSLAGTVLKLVYRDRYEAAWTAMIAAQGDDKAMKEWTKPWKSLGSSSSGSRDPVQKPDTSKLVGDQNEFLKRFQFKGM